MTTTEHEREAIPLRAERTGREMPHLRLCLLERFADRRHVTPVHESRLARAERAVKRHARKSRTQCRRRFGGSYATVVSAHPLVRGEARESHVRALGRLILAHERHTLMPARMCDPLAVDSAMPRTSFGTAHGVHALHYGWADCIQIDSLQARPIVCALCRRKYPQPPQR